MLLELPIATLKELCSDAVGLSDHVTRCVDVLKEQWNQLEKTAFWDDEDYGIDQDWEADEHSTPRLEHVDGSLNEQATRDLVAWLHAEQPQGRSLLGRSIQLIFRLQLQIVESGTLPHTCSYGRTVAE